MARYRKIDPRIWNDEKFSSFSERGKLLFFYVLTHPNMTMIGMLRATPEGLFSELGLSSADCQADWQALCHAGVVEYDKHGLVRLPNFLRYNEPESPSVVKAWSECYDLLPECVLLKRAMCDIEKYLISKGNSWIQAYRHTAKQPNGQTASQPAMQTARHQEQEQEQDIYSSLSKQPAVVTTEKESVDLPKQDKTPTKRIVELYNEQFKGKLPLVREITNKRRGLVRSVYDKMFKRCECANEDEGLIAVREYFSAIEKSKWLMGQDPKSNGWRADFDFVFTERCYVGMLEGKYANR